MVTKWLTFGLLLAATVAAFATTPQRASAQDPEADARCLWCLEILEGGYFYHWFANEYHSGALFMDCNSGHGCHFVGVQGNCNTMHDFGSCAEKAKTAASLRRAALWAERLSNPLLVSAALADAPGAEVDQSHEKITFRDCSGSQVAEIRVPAWLLGETAWSFGSELTNHSLLHTGVFGSIVWHNGSEKGNGAASRMAEANGVPQ